LFSLSKLLSVGSLVPHLLLTKGGRPCYSLSLFKDGLFSGALIGPDKDYAYSSVLISSKLLRFFFELTTPAFSL
jgi:hypothetical protein